MILLSLLAFHFEYWSCSTNSWEVRLSSGRPWLCLLQLADPLHHHDECDVDLAEPPVEVVLLAGISASFQRGHDFDGKRRHIAAVANNSRRRERLCSGQHQLADSAWQRLCQRNPLPSGRLSRAQAQKLKGDECNAPLDIATDLEEPCAFASPISRRG